MTYLPPPKLGTACLAATVTLLAPVMAHAATYYVDPGGNDDAAGTEGAPFRSMAGAQAAAQPGDTVLFKGGVYAYDRGTSTCSSGTSIISGIEANKSGSANNLIKYWAAPGEKPVLDFDGIRDSCRIKGILLSGDYIHLKGFEIQGVRQNNDLNHESWGIWISGDNNIVEQIDVHNIMGAGIFISGGANNLILNCDSHDNYDEHTSNGAGESADGFGCHGSGSGNVFRGCRAWWNTDDGYDFINATGHCTAEDSWAWYNGYLPGTMADGKNGNGFKAGGYGLDTSTFPANPPQHTVQRCLSVANNSAGFYANHHPGSPIFHNNTAWGNGANFNMLGIDSGGGDLTVGEYRNNISISGSLSNRNGADEANNSWTINGITADENDFQSVSIDGLDGPRQADGSLPNIPNFHLAENSDLIDKGVDLMAPFAGAAPDLGCFEVGLAPMGGAASAGGAATGGAPSGGTGGSMMSGNAGAGADGLNAGGMAAGGMAAGGAGGTPATTSGGATAVTPDGAATTSAGATSTTTGVVTTGSGGASSTSTSGTTDVIDPANTMGSTMAGGVATGAGGSSITSTTPGTTNGGASGSCRYASTGTGSGFPGSALLTLMLGALAIRRRQR